MTIMGIMDKIRAYQPVKDFHNVNLWVTSQNPDVANYATEVGEAAATSMGNQAVIAYGKIGADDQKITFTDNKTGEITAVYDLVNSAPEYYFTDMVFIQQKYEEALVDLYYYRAEASGASSGPEYRAIIDEAIAGTYWVAAQNGVTISEVEIQEKFLASLDEQLGSLVPAFVDRWDGVAPNISDEIPAFIDAVRAYYLDPQINTFENIIKVAIDIDSGIDHKFFEWDELTSDIVGKISDGLALSLYNHGHDNKDKFTMLDQQALSPVEISTQ